MIDEIEFPTAAYAITANLAAIKYKEDLPDVFDCLCPSRARFMALAIMCELYPKGSVAGMARCLGFQGSGKDIASIFNRAKNCKWFDHFVLYELADKARDQLRMERAYELETGDELPVARVSTEQVASEFVPRKVRPARIVMARAARPANVTGALMGDPGFTSRRVAANEMSRGLT